MQEVIDKAPKYANPSKLPTLPAEKKEYVFLMYDPNEKPSVKKPKPSVCACLCVRLWCA